MTDAVLLPGVVVLLLLAVGVTTLPVEMTGTIGITIDMTGTGTAVTVAGTVVIKTGTAATKTGTAVIKTGTAATKIGIDVTKTGPVIVPEVLMIGNAMPRTTEIAAMKRVRSMMRSTITALTAKTEKVSLQLHGKRNR